MSVAHRFEASITPRMLSCSEASRLWHPPSATPAGAHTRGPRLRSGLGDLSREYTLDEIAIITRAAPARMLGLRHKGHLGPGADGDVTIYAPDDDKRRTTAQFRIEQDSKDFGRSWTDTLCLLSPGGSGEVCYNRDR